jgi:hypothetical protein
MKVHPFIAAAWLVLAGVVASGATVIVQHRKARARRPPPPPEVEEQAPAPRRSFPVVEAPPPRRFEPPAAPALKTELHVHVTGPHGIAIGGIDVFYHRRGDEEGDDWDTLDSGDEGQTFSGTDLEAGRYDLRVEGSGLRTVRLEDVAPGPAVIDVALARAPVLLGAVGALGGSGCAGVTVTWSSPDAGEGGAADVDQDDCTFVAETLPEVGPVKVVATRGARSETALVALPLSGDPSFLCLAPPCAVEAASLLVYLADTGGRPVDDGTLEWTLRGDERYGERGSLTGGNRLFVHDRRVGQTLTLRAARLDDDAVAVETTLAVGPGVNEVVLTMPAALETAEPTPDPGVTIADSPEP